MFIGHMRSQEILSDSMLGMVTGNGNCVMPSTTIRWRGFAVKFVSRRRRQIEENGELHGSRVNTEISIEAPSIVTYGKRIELEYVGNGVRGAD